MRARRWTTVIGGVLAANVLFASAALAFDCINTSIPAPTESADDGPIFHGRYVWLPSVGVEIEAWGFPVPENFQNGESWHLLQGSAACGNEHRQTEHGIQVGDC